MTKNLATLAVFLFLAACDAPEEPPKSERPAKRVEIEPVVARSLTDVLELPATIEARESTTLATGRAGRIDGIGADTGDRVKKGQVLVRINAASAYAELKQAEAAHDSAQATYQRIENLLSRKLASDSQMDTAKATLAQTEAALELARANVNYAVLRAPHSGFVASRTVAVGEFAQPGAALLDLVDIDTVKLVVRVPERDIDTIQSGSKATFTADALGPETFAGAVSRIGVVADAAARTFDVEVEVKNPGSRLKPGMLARVKLPRRSLENVPVIRRDAVVEDLDGPTVFLALEGKAQRRPVRLGPVNGDHVAVLEGLEPDEPLVVVGQRMLVTGEPVKIVRKGDTLRESVAKAEE